MSRGDTDTGAMGSVKALKRFLGGLIALEFVQDFANISHPVVYCCRCISNTVSIISGDFHESRSPNIGYPYRDRSGLIYFLKN
jgi:hypothetical protein